MSLNFKTRQKKTGKKIDFNIVFSQKKTEIAPSSSENNPNANALPIVERIDNSGAPGNINDIRGLIPGDDDY